MKNKSYIGISFIILVFGIIFIPRIIDRIKNDDVTKMDRLNINGQKETTEDLIMKIGPAPKFSLINQFNQLVTNETYKGKVYLVEFFFSTCPTICPLMNENMIKIQNHFEGNPNFGIVSITINPEHDTPEVLKAHAEHLGINNPNWNFLSGEKNYIFDLANKGFNIYAGQNKDVDGGFEHSGLFALIDKNGNIRSRKDTFGNPIVYYDGLEEAGVLALQQDIKVLLEE
ncbi:SCO family protein [Flavobacterium sp.]|uniref:SCO family protein n=1 Tax=Flavobacterium sp. TaxID=239 RepID=UPI0026254B8A|nr:SCO family protein [Flavobacterium sp.]MDD2987117.1 SCO family protein [Flavobacterium sp.]